MRTFVQKHYAELAALMRRAKIQDDTDQQGGLDMLQRLMIEMLKQDSPSFDRDKFESACDPSGFVGRHK